MRFCAQRWNNDLIDRITHHLIMVTNYLFLNCFCSLQRHDVVNGLLEVEATDEADREGKLFTFVYQCSLVHFLLIASGLSFNSEKGIPNFWLTAMKTNDTLAELVREFMYICFLQFPLLKGLYNSYVLSFSLLLDH